MKTGLDLDFIHRTLKTTGVVLLIGFFFGIYYFGFWPSLAFFSGGIWGMVNLIFITSLIKVAVRPGGADVMKSVGLGIVKFPMLYAAGYFLLKVPQFEPLHLLAGFTLLFVIIVLKVVGRAITGLNDNKQHNGNFGQA